MLTILDFCGYCGSLLEEGQGLEEEPRCLNCGNLVKDRDNRVQGTFSALDADRLHQALNTMDLENAKD